MFPYQTPTPTSTPTATATATAGFLGQQLHTIVIIGVVVIVLLLVLAAVFSRLRMSRQTSEVDRPSRQPAGPTRITAPEPAISTARFLVRPDGQQVALKSLPVTLGKARSNAIVLDGASVAEVHARIYLDPVESMVVLEDASEGNNPILVNGKPTCKNILSNNDEIALGDVRLRYVEAAPGLRGS